MPETPWPCHGGKEEHQDTGKSEGPPMIPIEKGNKGQTLSCDDFGLRSTAVLRRSRGDPQQSLQAGSCSWGTPLAGLCGRT